MDALAVRLDFRWPGDVELTDEQLARLQGALEGEAENWLVILGLESGQEMLAEVEMSASEIPLLRRRS